MQLFGNNIDRTCGVGLALLVVAGLTFINAFKTPFLLDDYSFFSSHQRQSLGSYFLINRNATLNLESASTDRSYYRPLAHVVPLSFHRAFGGRVAGYRLANIILLWLAGLCVYGFLRSLGRAGPPGLGGKEEEDRAEVIAFWAAAFFIAHPVNGIMVNYVTASVFSVQVILMLGSLGCLLKREDGRGERGDVSSFFLLPASIFLYVLATMCHETAVLLPAYAALVLRLTMPWKDVLRRVWPLFAALVVYFLFRSYASPFSQSILYSLSILDLTWDQKLASVIKLLSWYMAKLFAPQSVVLMWGTPFVQTHTWVWILSAAVILGLVVYVCRKVRDNFLTMSAGWFILGLTPVLAGAFVTPFMGGLIEPHWFIFATVGLFAAVVTLIHKFISRRAETVLCVILCALVILSWRNNHIWADERRLCEQWLKEAPEFKPVRYFTGLAYTRAGDHQKAYGHFEQALVGRHKDWMVHLEMGLIDLHSGNWTRSQEHLAKAYELEPDHSGVLNAFGGLIYKQGDLEKAKMFFERAVERNPYNPEPRMNLAAYYLKKEQPHKSMEIYQQILAIDPSFLPARRNLDALQRQGP